MHPITTRCRRRPPLAALAIALCAFACLPAAASGQSGIRTTPDGKRILINKDVGGERWAIARNVADGTVTGNVFRPDGGAPQFLWCEEESRAGGEVELSCLGADRCPLAPCAGDEWQFIATVRLPEELFSPPVGAAGALSPAAADAVARGVAAPLLATVGGARPARPASARGMGSLPGQTVQLLAADADRARTTDSGTPSAGVQLTPDVAQTLVSKDVAGQRWAITVHADDQTVTGNVFFPGGGEPQFVWCERRDASGGEVRLACSGAAACATSGCTAGDWTFIAEVALPVTFFEAPQQVELAAVTEALRASFGDDEATRAVLLAVDRGYSLRQIVRAGLTGWLQVSGAIATHAGGFAVPDGPPLGLFGDTAASTLATEASAAASCDDVPHDLRARVAESFDLDDLIRSARENDFPPGFALLDVITVLLAEGYDAGTIVGSLLTGAQVEFDEDSLRWQIVEIDAAGGRKVLEPERPSLYDSPISLGRCGNGLLDGGELCETGLPVPRTCAEYDPRRFTAGTPSCTFDCRYDTSACSRPAACGNGVVDAGEDCDGAELEGATCRDLGFFSGTLRCDQVCTFDDRQCVKEPTENPCGDGILDGDEECDGANLGGATCSSSGDFDDGRLRCTDGCRLDTSRCTSCGNGVREGAERCDGNDVSGSCQDFGYGPGTVRCSSTCVRDFSGCAQPSQCGNGVREGSEECDDRDFGGQTCESRGYTRGRLRCTDACTISEAKCSSEQCEGSDVECGAGCMPAGGDCCTGDGAYCEPGSVCAGDACCPASLPQPCPPANCAPAGSVCCGNGDACPAGTVCVLGGAGCCPDETPKACPAAGVCVGAGVPCP